jgi:hypothetical protein
MTTHPEETVEPEEREEKPNRYIIAFWWLLAIAYVLAFFPAMAYVICSMV